MSFIRVVQGIPSARSLWEISILAQFGGGDNAVFARAVGPFTHPVGTGHYFVLPLVLAGAWFYQSVNLKRWRTAGAICVLGILFAGADFAPISRGAWIAVGLALLLCSLIYRRRALIVAAVVLTGVLFLTVPSVNHSITAVINGNDASSQDHVEALDKGVRTLLDHPVGMGVGQSDQFGQVLATGDSAGAGVGENMYITLWISTGPLGLLVFLAWMAGLLWHLAVVRHRAPPPSWIVIGTGAALVGYAVAAMLAAPLMRFTTSASVWLLVGLCVGLMVGSSRSAKDSDVSGEGETATASAG